MKLFSTNGRAGRAEYFWHSLIGILALVAVITASFTFEIEDGPTVPIIFFSAIVTYFVAEVCVTVRRLHDLNKSGGEYFYLFIPLYNIYFGMVLLFVKGSESPNKYGEDPLLEFEERRFPIELQYLIEVVLLFGLVYFLNDQRSIRKEQTLTELKSNPRVNDIYIHETNTTDVHNHEILKVSYISQDSIELQVGAYSYDLKSGAKSEIKRGAIDSVGYFLGTYVIHNMELDSMNIVEIIRKE